MRRPVYVLTAVLLFVSLGTVSGFAQVTAAVSGTVNDPSGAAVSGVTVTIKSMETGSSRVTTTDRPEPSE